MNIKEKVQALIDRNCFEHNTTNSCICTVARAISELSRECVYEKLIKSGQNEFISLVEAWADAKHIIYIDLFTCSHVVLLFYNTGSYYILNSYENIYSPRIQQIWLKDIYDMEFSEQPDVLYNKYFNTSKPCKTFLPEYSGIMFRVYKVYDK